MKTLSQISLDKQLEVGQIPDTINKLFLYEQFSGEIVEVLSSGVIRVRGDATSHFSINDITLVPLSNFEQEITINSDPAYNSSDNTTLINASGTPFFIATDVGKNLAVKSELTERVVKDGYGDIVEGIEGNTLQSYDSGVMKIEANNADGFLQKRNKTGLFDQGNVIWGKYLTGFKGANENVNRFGGLVDLTELVPNLFDKTITFKIYGHSRELERIPAFHLMDENETQLIKLPGFEIDSFTPAAGSEAGVKELKYRPFGSSKLKGVQVLSVSDDTEPGIYVLEFRYPYQFRWDNGAYQTIDEVGDYDDADAGTVKLLAIDGTSTSKYAIVQFGDADSLNEFPGEDAESWVAIKLEKFKSEIGDQGEPTIEFDNGEETNIKLHFQRVLDFNGVSTYTSIEPKLNSRRKQHRVAAMNVNNDELIIIAPERFFGMEFLMNQLFTASDIDFQYSTGGNTWSPDMGVSENLIDGTTGFQQNGKITWGDLTNWRVNHIVIDATTSFKGFMVKAIRNSATGVFEMFEIRRILRLRGENGDFLQLKLIQENLKPEDADDEVVLTFIGEVWKVGTWFQNVALDSVLTSAMDIGNYPPASRTLSDMKITGITKRFNVWGKPPKLNYPFLPFSGTVDGTNEFVYLGIGLELWRSNFKGGWTKLSDLSPFIAEEDKTFAIKWMFDVATDVWMMVTREYDGLGDFGFEIQTHAWVFSWNKSTQVLTQHNTPSGALWHTMEKSFRAGKTFDVGGGNFRNIIGQDDNNSRFAGENVTIAFRQITSLENPGLVNNNDYHEAVDLDTQADPAPQLWVFDQFPGTHSPGSGPFFSPEMGHYFLNDASANPSVHTDLRFWHEYGNQGSIIIAPDKTDFFILETKLDADANTVYEYRGIKNDSNAFALAAWYRKGHLPICVARDATTDTLYFGFTQWLDDGQDIKSFSYVTEWDKDKVHDWDQVWQFNNTGSVFTDRTTETNAQTNVPGITDEIGDIIYFGLLEKYRSLVLIGLNATYAFEYWNGSAWTTLQDTPASLGNLRLIFLIPRDWTLTSINGSTSLYYVRLRVTAIAFNDDLVTGFCMERVLWDSQDWSEAAEIAERYMAIRLEFDIDKNDLHIILFNRENLASESFPFQWEYGVIHIADDSVHFFNLTNDGSTVGFTYDASVLPTDMVYNTVDNKIYLMYEDIRYQDSPAFLATAEYDAISDTITITKLGTPQENEWGSKVNLMLDNVTGNIFGITQGSRYRLWEFGTAFWPRIEIARFDESDNLKQILGFIAERSINHFMIHHNRTIRFVKRGTSNGNLDFDWGKNFVKNKPSIPYWKHFFDAVKVSWENFVDETTGNRKRGFTGFQKKILSINNPLIQTTHDASLVLDESFDFFTSYRLNPKRIRGIYLIQFELLDKFKLLIPTNILDTDNSIEYIIEKSKLSPEEKRIEVEGIEILDTGNDGAPTSPLPPPFGTLAGVRGVVDHWIGQCQYIHNPTCYALDYQDWHESSESGRNDMESSSSGSFEIGLRQAILNGKDVVDMLDPDTNFATIFNSHNNAAYRYMHENGGWHVLVWFQVDTTLPTDHATLWGNDSYGAEVAGFQMHTLADTYAFPNAFGFRITSGVGLPVVNVDTGTTKVNMGGWNYVIATWEEGTGRDGLRINLNGQNFDFPDTVFQNPFTSSLSVRAVTFARRAGPQSPFRRGAIKVAEVGAGNVGLSNSEIDDAVLYIQHANIYNL